MSKRVLEDVNDDGAIEESKRAKPQHNADIVATLKEEKSDESATATATSSATAIALSNGEAIAATAAAAEPSSSTNDNGHVVQNGDVNDLDESDSSTNGVTEEHNIELNNQDVLSSSTSSSVAADEKEQNKDQNNEPNSNSKQTESGSPNEDRVEVSDPKKQKVESPSDSDSSASDDEKAAAERMFGGGGDQVPDVDGAVPGGSRDTSDNSQSLVGFQQTRILMNDPKSKRVHVLGKFKDDDEDAIVTMVKTPFSEESVSKILSNETTLKDADDQCGSCSAITTPLHNSINTQIIKPASSRHIMKYTERRPFLIFETPEVYADVTKPWLESHRYGVQWVYNILEHKQESERIQFEDPDKSNGFVLIPCVKWDMKQVEDLFMIALVQRRDLECLRDLNAEHLPLLKNILAKGMETITTKYNLKSSQIRAYIHYLPSYEHFHVNFSHLMHDSGGVQTEKAHLLNDVIYNIENISSDFYEKRTLPVKLYEGDPLLGQLFSAVGMF